MSKFRKMVRAIVTGSNGFIGYNLCRRLVAEGNYHVLGIDDLSTGDSKYICGPIQYEMLDVSCNQSRLQFIIDHFKPDVVFHLAAIPRVPYSWGHPHETCQANVLGTVALLERISNKTRFVFASSNVLYGDHDPPFEEGMDIRIQSPYALEKSQGEQWCQFFSKEYRRNIMVLRYFNVFGPYMKFEGDYSTVIMAWLWSIFNEETSYITKPGNQSRDFTYVDDVVEATILAGRSKHRGFEIVNVGSGVARTLFECKSVIEEVTGKELILETWPQRKNEQFCTLADMRKAERILNFKPDTNFKEQVKKTAEYVRGGDH